MAGNSAVRVPAQNEEELVRLACEGDRQAADQLAVGYQGFIRMRASQFNLAGLDLEDLTQEGTIGLIDAVRNFDSNKGASFRTYATHCITSKIISAVRSALRKKQQPLNGYLSLDDTSAASQAAQCSVVDPEDMVVNREAVSAVNDAIVKCLTPAERKIFALYLAGFTYSVIAKRLNVGEKHVDNALQRMKKKLSLNAAG